MEAIIVSLSTELKNYDDFIKEYFHIILLKNTHEL